MYVKWAWDSGIPVSPWFFFSFHISFLFAVLFSSGSRPSAMLRFLLFEYIQVYHSLWTTFHTLQPYLFAPYSDQHITLLDMSGKLGPHVLSLSELEEIVKRL